MNNYKPTIGIEIHLELKTNAKAFTPSLNSYNSVANVNVNEIDFAYPGTLPLVNEGVVKKAIKACLGLNMNIARKMHFDRKNYFYPDLPKGYQITQFKTPIGRNGYVVINTESGMKKIGISDIHIEEDTCKSLHYNGKTLLNYNRCGVPLIEIVSCPDMHSKQEAMAYAESIRETMLYLNVSDCKIEEGSMRCDVNISVSKNDDLGVRAEIKNIGSISNIGDAIDFEIKRQTDLLEKGEKLFEETRKFDSSSGTTIFMRKKDSDTDYRYFPEPDIPFLILDEGMIDELRDNLEMLPNERRSVYSSLGISDINIKKLMSNKELSNYFNSLLNANIDFTTACNLLVGDISSYLNKRRISIFETKLSIDKFVLIVNSLSKGEISSKIFKEILDDVMEKDLDIVNLLEENKQTSSKQDVIKVISAVLETYPDSVLDYKNGKENAIKFLMGMVMKTSGGKINPQIAMEYLKEELNK